MAMTLAELMPQASEPATPVARPGAMTLAEVRGDPIPPPTFLDNLRGFLPEFAVSTAKSLGRAAADVGEFVTAGPGMLAGAVAGGLRSVEQLAKGASRREALQEGTETAGRVGAVLNPVTAVKTYLGDTTPSALEGPMKALAEGIHRYGMKVEAHTKIGEWTPLLAEDVDAAANLFMAAAMGKATARGVVSLAEKAYNTAAPKPHVSPGVLSRALNRDLGKQPGRREGSVYRTYDEVPAEPVKQQPLSYAEQSYEQPGPVMNPPSEAEIIAKSKQRIKDIKAAVKAETPQERAMRESAFQAPPTGTALWKSGDVEHPITILGEPEKGSDGVYYTQIKSGDNTTYVPSHELRPLTPPESQVGLPEIAQDGIPYETPGPIEAAPKEPYAYEGALEFREPPPPKLTAAQLLARFEAEQAGLPPPREAPLPTQTRAMREADRARSKAAKQEFEELSAPLTEAERLQQQYEGRSRPGTGRKVQGPKTREASALLTGLDKVRQGQGALMTPLEQSAVAVTDRAGPMMRGPAGERLKSGFNERGQVDPRLLAGLGIGSVAVWAALHPEEQAKLAGLGLIGATAAVGKGSAKTLGIALRDVAPYTDPILRALPRDSVNFSKAQIEGLLNRQEIPAASKDVMRRVLATVEGKRITAQELVGGFAEEVASWKLSPVTTDTHALYGLENINRIGYEATRPLGDDTPPPTARTTKYHLPEHMHVGDQGHFNDGRTFGWTRSFDEGGVEHVVEIQSDVAQKAGKASRNTAEVRSSLEQQLEIFRDYRSGIVSAPTKDFLERLDAVNPDSSLLIADRMDTLLGQLEAYRQGSLDLTSAIGRLEDFADPKEYIGKVVALAEKEPAGGDSPYRHTVKSALRQTFRHLEDLLQQARSRISTETLNALGPMLSNWPRRLIRETLLDAQERVLRAQASFPERTLAMREMIAAKEAGDAARVSAAQEAIKAFDRELAMSSKVRFASASTVAMVEGWPGFFKGDEANLVKRIERIDRELPVFEINQTLKEAQLRERAEYVQALKDLKTKDFVASYSGHQSIYNRYAGEITRYLKNLGGVEVRDSFGHTWWEVDSNKVMTKNGPAIDMLGAADPKVLAAAAAAVGVAALAADPEKLKALGLAGIIGMTAKGSFKGMSEALLLDAARAGKQGAITELYRQHEGRLKRSLHSYERVGVDVEDVVQQTFVSAFSHLDSFKGESAFSTWLHRIAQNKAKDSLDRAAVRPETTELTPEIEKTAGHGETPQKALEAKALGARLEDALNSIDPKFKDAFLLREAEGMEYADIAEKLGIPINTVRSRISRAKEALQKQLAEYSYVKQGFGETGAATVRQQATIAAMAGGAALGAYLDPEHWGLSAAKGGVAGLLLANVKPKAWVEAIRRANLEGPLVSISDAISQRAYAMKVLKRSVYQMTTRIEDVVPEAARRENIYMYLAGEKHSPLSNSEQAIATQIRAFYDGLGQAAKDAGVVTELLEDYATRIYKKPDSSLFDPRSVGGKMGLDSPFGKPRHYETLEQAANGGYVPLTTDIARVLEIYADSVGAAIENRRLIKSLRASELSDGTKLVAKEANAPREYVFIDHPQLRGYRVHPDIAADMRFMFDSKQPGAILSAIDAINSTQKRLGVTMSMFHVAALEHAMIGATSIFKSPGIAVKTLAQSFAPRIFGESLALKMIREGGVGDGVDYAMKSGLEFGFERRGSVVEEERPGLYKALEVTTNYLNETIPHAGTLTTGAFLQLNKAFDRAMWGRFHTTVKLGTFLEKTSELYRNNARAVEAGKAERMSRDEIGRAAASFTNDLYGGLNWHGIVGEMGSRWSRELASAIMSPSGRFGMRMLLFAPDWTISTTRAFAKAFGPRGLAAASGAIIGSQLNTETDSAKRWGGALGAMAGYGLGKAVGLEHAQSGGVAGILNPRTLTDLHRQYVLRSAFIYTAIVDTLNVQLSGHHIWDNKDKTRLDLGDGTMMQVSKHFMEPIHWLVDPMKQAMGKASFVVKETATQLEGKEYWSPKGAPRMGATPTGQDLSLGTRIGHAGRQFMPISAQGFESQNPQKALWSLGGMPVYGKTRTEQAEAKAALKALHATPEYKALAAERKRLKKEAEQ